MPPVTRGALGDAALRRFSVALTVTLALSAASGEQVPVAARAAEAQSAPPSVASTARSAQDLLAASDLVRNPANSFALTNTLTEYRNGRQTDTSTLFIYSKADPASGRYRNLIRYLAPARDLNKLILFAGEDLWFYDPSSRSSVRLSPQQRLLGQAANGDVVTVNFARDYRAEQASDDDIADGERTIRHCQRLSLSAASADANYSRIDMWVEKGTARPVKAKFYAESGKMLKTAYYRRFEMQLGQSRPTETVIIDGLDPSWVTVMRFTDWAQRDIPDAWLQRDYLAHFSPPSP
jgi:outer membrane lipoprotein-sorting protein